VAQAYNPSYSRGRDKEDGISKPAWEIVHKTLSQKYPTLKKAGGIVQLVEHLHSNGESKFIPLYHQKRKESGCEIAIRSRDYICNFRGSLSFIVMSVILGIIIVLSTLRFR
jgi:hypothetical protein